MQTGGSAWLKEQYELFTPVREEAEQYSEEEVDATIDEVANGVRRSRDS